MQSAPAIAFDYRPSRLLAAAAGAVLLLAIVAVAISGLGNVWKIGLVLAASAYEAFSLRCFLRHAGLRCAWHAGGQWRLRDRHGQEHAAVLLHCAVRGPMIALALRAGALGRVDLVLLPDNCDAETRRLLRVRLLRADALAVEQ